jgi:peptide/nickel transport system permease protein
MTTPVLFDLPGPKARARIRIGTVVGAVLVLAVIAFVLIRLAGNQQLDPQRWSVLFDPASGVPQALGEALVRTLQVAAVGMVFATVFGLLGGVTLGTLAGAFGGWVDAFVMRLVDVMLSIPSLLLAFTIASLARSPSQWTLIVAIATIQVPIFARLLRGSMLAQRSSDHVLAARSLGVKPRAIVFRHMLPNATGPVIVQATLVLAVAIIDAAALSFLGLGNPDQRQPEWGQMLGLAQGYIAEAPHLAFYPATCIIVVALGFTLMGESLREALDPKSRR